VDVGGEEAEAAECRRRRLLLLPPEQEAVAAGAVAVEAAAAGRRHPHPHRVERPRLPALQQLHLPFLRRLHGAARETPTEGERGSVRRRAESEVWVETGLRVLK